MKLSIRLAALGDLSDAHEWYEKQQPDLGEEFLAAVDEVLARILERPKLYRVLLRDTRQALVRRFPYGFSTESSGTRSWSLPVFMPVEILVGGRAGGEPPRVAPLRSLSMILDQHEGREHVSVSRGTVVTEVTASRLDSLIITFTIPEGIFEWFVAVVDRDLGEEILSDWCDHFATDGETDEQVHRQRAEEIGRVLDAVVDAPLRLVGELKPSLLSWRKPRSRYTLQARSGGDWEQLIPM